MPFLTKEQIAAGDYPKWEGNTQFEKDCLKYCGLPEDYHPSEAEAQRIIIAALED